MGWPVMYVMEMAAPTCKRCSGVSFLLICRNSGNRLKHWQKGLYLVVNGVKLGENNSINEPRPVRHGVVGQSLVELHLRTQVREVSQ